MGYTHYIKPKRNLTIVEAKNVINDILEIESYIKSNKIKCVTAGSYEGEPIKLDVSVYAKVSNKKYTPSELFLNGIGENSHEALCIMAGKIDSSALFCKTARKPYDTAVCLSLISLNYFVSHCNISSDGNIKDWQGAIDLWYIIFPNRKDFEFKLK